MNDQQIRERLQPEYRDLYQSFREMGMEQEAALKATAGRGGIVSDIVPSESARVVGSFQEFGLSVSEAETAARGRLTDDTDLLRERRLIWDGNRVRRPLPDQSGEN